MLRADEITRGERNDCDGVVFGGVNDRYLAVIWAAPCRRQGRRRSAYLVNHPPIRICQAFDSPQEEHDAVRSLTPNRHTLASRCVMAGNDLRTVQVLGRWKPLAMLSRYNHRAPGHLQAAVERIVAPPVCRDCDCSLTVPDSYGAAAAVW